MSTLQDNGIGAGAAPPRTDRSTSGLRTGAAASLPKKQTHRSWGLVSLAALLVVGSGLAVAAWGLSAGQKESVLVVNGAIAKGEVIEREDLVSKAVAGLDDTVPVGSANSVVGQTAAVDLVEGQILGSAMFTNAPVPGVGKATVGLALEASRVPGAGLQPGDSVDVIAIPAGEQADSEALDSPLALAKSAQVYAVGGEPAAGGQVLVTLIVPAPSAAQIAAYSTQNRVAVVETAPLRGQ